ncbi:AMP-binding protein [Rhodococcus sp. T7]|uniref:AMP-binding protein n=1 Tax=Rhodococcus sp. T7 TaxID=627444 RepID=UPI00135B6C57|nr:AMP-binding protein [Rhodococcus sp. T7]KAF0957871.1 Medium-chain fatty-acid--CoA ligase [Rhodococcus sp. T7]KAF0961476.1 Medium-chain fatty-acid--CoA ligase [Rhodococcus sp. T7]
MRMRQHKGAVFESSLRPFNADDVAKFEVANLWREETFLDDFLVAAGRHPDKAAVVSYSKGTVLPNTVTYGQLAALVDRFAAQLLELGVQPSDVVTIQVPNGWEGAALALATMRVGAVPNPIPIIYRERELRFMLAHAGTKVLFVPEEFRGYDYATMAQGLKAETPTLEHVFVLNASRETPGCSSFEETFLGSSGQIDAEVSEALDRRRPGSDDIAMLVFTSGTTGTPKAAMHTYNTAWSGYHRVVTRALELTGDDVAFMASTLGHLTGFIHGMLVPLSTGQKIVYQDVWDVEGLLDTIAVEGITWTLSATTFALDMIETQKQRPRTQQTFRAFACGGAAIPASLAESMHELFGTSLVSLWGCSETGIASIHQLGADVHTLGASDGFRVPWQDVRIVDEHGQAVLTGVTGSLQVRGPSVFAGYYKQPELTAAAFTADGWFDTGDLGRITPDGGIRVEGRTKDIIIRGGQNISAVEIENALFSHEHVQEAAVVAYPDERLGERVCAVVVPAGPAPTLDDLVKHLEKVGMSKQFWPQKLVVTQSLPRTPSGKIKKFVLTDQLAQGGPVGVGG